MSVPEWVCSICFIFLFFFNFGFIGQESRLSIFPFFLCSGGSTRTHFPLSFWDVWLREVFAFLFLPSQHMLTASVSPQGWPGGTSTSHTCQAQPGEELWKNPCWTALLPLQPRGLCLLLTGGSWRADFFNAKFFQYLPSCSGRTGWEEEMVWSCGSMGSSPKKTWELRFSSHLCKKIFNFYGNTSKIYNSKSEGTGLFYFRHYHSLKQSPASTLWWIHFVKANLNYFLEHST